MLSRLEVKVSGIIPAQVKDIWPIIRDWGAQTQWATAVYDASDVRSILMPGYHKSQIGAQRLVVIGNGSFVDQLEGLDDELLILKWKLVSHSLNINPFPASFVNWRCEIRLFELTREEATVMIWSGSLDTDPHAVELMRREMLQRINICFDGLIAVMNDLLIRSQSEREGSGTIGKGNKLAAYTLDSSGSLDEQESKWRASGVSGRTSSGTSGQSEPRPPTPATPTLRRKSEPELAHQAQQGKIERQKSLNIPICRSRDACSHPPPSCTVPAYPGYCDGNFHRARPEVGATFGLPANEAVPEKTWSSPVEGLQNLSVCTTCPDASCRCSSQDQQTKCPASARGIAAQPGFAGHMTRRCQNQ